MQEGTQGKIELHPLKIVSSLDREAIEFTNETYFCVQNLHISKLEQLGHLPKRKKKVIGSSEEGTFNLRSLYMG